jgi:hypothetical protein
MRAASIWPGLLSCALLTPAIAQTPDATVDWAALAQTLTVEGDTDVVAAIPANQRAMLKQLAARMTEEECRVALQEVDIPSASSLAAAVAVLSEPTGDKSTPEALLREVSAARHWLRFVVMQQASASLAGSRERPWAAVGEPARRRARAALAVLLREHPTAPETGVALLTAADSTAADAGIAAWAARLATTPAAKDRLSLATWLGRQGQLGAANEILANLGSAKPPRTIAHAEWLTLAISDAERLQSRMAALQRTADGDSVDAKVDRLRLLALRDSAAADAEIRALVAAGVPHAAPWTMLAGKQFAAGQRAEAEISLQRAIGLPGADTSTAVLAIMLRLLNAGTGPDAADFLTGMNDVLRDADGIVAKDSSPLGTLYRGMRDLGWPAEREGMAMIENLAGLRELAAELPDSMDVHRLMLAAALLTEDTAAARAALLAKPAPAITRSLAMVRLRAEVATMLAIRLPTARERHDFPETFLQALAAMPHGAADANHLRSLLAWSEAKDDPDPTATRCHAAELFATDSRMPFDRGAWQAASSRWVATVHTKAPPDNDAMMRVRELSRAVDQPATLVPMLATALLAADGDDIKNLCQDARRFLESLADAPVAAMVMNSALAEAESRLGNRTAARTHAKQALSLRDAAAPVQSLLDRGVLARREVRWKFGYHDNEPSLATTLSVELFALPELPSSDRLRQLAADD